MKPGMLSRVDLDFFVAGILLLGPSTAAQRLAPPAPANRGALSSILQEDASNLGSERAGPRARQSA